MELGVRLGRYEVLSRLAVGGMAELWLARACATQEPVVIKTMLAHLHEAAEFVQMFAREAELSERLRHPNIVQVLESGHWQGEPFIAMEHIPGRSLRHVQQRVPGRRLPTGLALRIAAQACDGLHHAHRMGVLHRDVSPENLMVTFTGLVKVIDFGAAQPVALAACGRTGKVVGKFCYLAPERVQGLAGDARSDVYALGVVLYECLTGVAPYAGADMAALCQIMEGRAADPQDVDPALPDDVAGVVRKAMARDPAERYDEMAVLATDLRACLDRVRPGTAEAGEPDPELSGYVRSLFRDAPGVPGEVRTVLLPRRDEDGGPGASIDLDLGDIVDIDGLASRELLALSADLEIEEQRTSVLRVAGTDEARTGAWAAPDPREEEPDLFAGRPATLCLKTDVFSVTRAGTGVLSRPDVSTWPPAPPRAPAPSSPPALAPSWPPAPPAPSRQAAERFDRGLALVRERSYPSALREWEDAVRMEPENRTYKTNLRRLREILATRAPSERREHGHQE